MNLNNLCRRRNDSIAVRRPRRRRTERHSGGETSASGDARPLHRVRTSGQSQARNLSVHARRAVAGRHVRSQAAAGEVRRASGRIRWICARSGRPAACCRRHSQFKKYGAGGHRSERTGAADRRRCIDDICVIRSMYTFNPTHTPARSLFHTGTILATRPSTGAWISYGLGTENENLPAFVVLSPGGGGGGGRCRAPDSCRPSIRASPSATPKSSRRR